jgi:hypothetical protein
MEFKELTELGAADVGLVAITAGASPLDVDYVEHDEVAYLMIANEEKMYSEKQ